MGWKDDKDLGSWNFTEQGNVYGYLNNPRWSSQQDAREFCEQMGISLNPTETHRPCKHWHKGIPLVPTYVSIIGNWWQQDVLYGDDGLIYLTAVNWDKTPNYVGISINDATDVKELLMYTGSDDTLTIDGVELAYDYGYPPSITKASDFTVIVGGEVWTVPDGDSDSTNTVICGVKRDGVDEYWHMVVNKLAEKKVGDVSNINVRYGYAGEVYEGGVIIACYDYWSYVASEARLCVIRSTDYGVTWNSEIIVATNKGEGILKKGDDSKLYLVTYKTGYVYVYISSDQGATWTEKTLPALGTPTPNGKVDISVNANGKIYVAVARALSSSVYVSSDGGNNWTKYDNSLIDTIPLIEANNTTLILYGYDISDNHPLLLKSTDDGNSFAEKVDMDDLGHPAGAAPLLSHNGEVFIHTYCGMRNDDNELGYLISKDNGDTWNLYYVDVLGYQEGSFEVSAGTIIPEEPQVWPMD